MKKLFTRVLPVTLVLASCTAPQQSEPVAQNDRYATVDSLELTNNFYDNVTTHTLQMSPVTVEGEVKNSGVVNTEALPLRSVIVKETLLDGEGDRFVGAYRYDGYSLFDMLSDRILDKANADQFKPIIDLYVEVSNDAGDKVVLSWGEIFYPNHLHEIIVATRVARIVPSKTKDLWPLPAQSKLVVAHDLITERNISNPTHIVVKSATMQFEVNKGMNPLYAGELTIYDDHKAVKTLQGMPNDLPMQTEHTIFYGRGRGIHSTQPFSGVYLRDVLAPLMPRNAQALKTGHFVISAADGYRGVYTYAELMNRNDQQQTLLICDEQATTDGIFRLFPACDFFSDRAIKAVSGIHYIR